MWAIDETGDLLLVETKRSNTAKSKRDPLEDFVTYEHKDDRMYAADGTYHLGASFLSKRWESLFEQELTYFDDHLGMMKRGVWLDSECKGVLPYSDRRRTLWRWRDLYSQSLRQQLEDRANYADVVIRYLGKREGRGNPKPHYIGLFTVAPSGTLALPDTAVESYRKLIDETERSRVHLRGVHGSKTKEGRVCVREFSVEFAN
jgi:hypothetical protein